MRQPQPLQRFTARYHDLSGTWYVYDGLCSRPTRTELVEVGLATAEAGLWEAFWRRACARWWQQEWQGAHWWQVWR